MEMSTKTIVTYKTTVTGDKRNDGGRGLLVELFDFIREEKQVGKLTVQFGVGGSISSLVFEEIENVRKQDIEEIEAVENGVEKRKTVVRVYDHDRH